MDSQFCHHFFVLQYWHSVPLGDINLEMERWQIHIYTWYIDIFTSAIWTRWSIEYQISFLQDFAWHSSSIRKCVASRGCEQPPRKTSAWINVSLGSLGSSSLQVFALNNYQNYVELVSIATRKSNKKLPEIFTALIEAQSLIFKGVKSQNDDDLKCWIFLFLSWTFDLNSLQIWTSFSVNLLMCVAPSSSSHWSQPHPQLFSHCVNKGHLYKNCLL